MSDAMKALDEIERIAGLVDSVEYYTAESAMGDLQAIRMLARNLKATLRAALTPPADDEINAIRQRDHDAGNAYTIGFFDTDDGFTAHTDRATLLALVNRLSAELAKERERRVEVAAWQPIETAPRDGQDILVYCQDTNEMFVGFSNPEEIAADPSIFFYALRTDGARIGCRPHLWQPLPTPPATQHEDTP